MSNVAFAKLMGVSEGAVRQKRRNGKLTDWSKGNPAGSILPDGSIHPERGKAEYMGEDAQRSISGPRPQSYPEAQSVNKLKAAKLALEIKHKKIEVDQLEGRLIPCDDAKAELRAFVRLHRDGLLNFASRYGGQIAAEAGGEPVPIIAAIDKYIRLHLDETASADLPFDGPADGSD